MNMAWFLISNTLLLILMTWWYRFLVDKSTEKLPALPVNCKGRFVLHYLLCPVFYDQTKAKIGCRTGETDRGETFLRGYNVRDSIKYKWNISYSRDDIFICQEEQASSPSIFAITLVLAFLILPALGIEKRKHSCLEKTLLGLTKSGDKKTADLRLTDADYLSSEYIKDFHNDSFSKLPEILQKTFLHQQTSSVKNFMKKDICAWHQGPNHHLEHLLQFRRMGSLQNSFTAAPASSVFSHFVSKPVDCQHTTNTSAGNESDFHREGVRLASFRTFPETVPVSALRLAQAGFYYSGQGDRVICFSCGGAYSNWQAGDRPHVLHAHIAPHCLFVCGMDQRNQALPHTMTVTPDSPNLSPRKSLGPGCGSPLAVTSASRMQGNQSHRISGNEIPDPSGISETAVMPGSGPEDSGILTLPVSLQGSANQALGQFPYAMDSGQQEIGRVSLQGSANQALGQFPYAMDSGQREIGRQEMPSSSLHLGCAVYPLYSQLDARRRSFQTWPHRHGLPSIDELVTLGFFYAGYADCVRCFFCGIGLKSWEPEDNPAQVHASWRPTCQYLRLVKGDSFVDRMAPGHSDGIPLEQAGNQASDAVGNGASGLPAQGSSAQLPIEHPNTDDRMHQGSENTRNQELPETDAVRAARFSGYSDNQISSAVSALRDMGSEQQLESMLIDVLSNMFDSAADHNSAGSTG